ncbi:D-glycero-beta-D-manno-heptose-7-phosphate kinase [Algivirga pacifica]|uniref:D-glycero-beta-D-manno-heptose-7-phosphate kinase n=1 Tax=Algivirga pacifica TaxID=1162670 RepID=A0ABP9D1H3_9BACT
MEKLFDSFNQLKVLIIGDVMIDSYVWGKVSRISPEAPVPVVDVQQRESRLGGAANVARNIAALGATPILCSVIGDDEEAHTLEGLLQEMEVPTHGLIRSKDRKTTVKHRILAGSQQIVRIDSEDTHPISESESHALVRRVQELLQEADVVIFEDYDKGVLTQENIQAILQVANQLGIPSTVDPKKRNFMHYEGATLFKPNLKEMKEGLQVDMEGSVLEIVHKGSRLLQHQMKVDHLLITLSEHGVFITDFKEDWHIPAHKREIADVSGAGDTVISIASLCLAKGIPLPQIAALSNLGGGLVCEHLGVVPIDKAKLLEEAKKLYI